jgi:hypothetical protein
MNSENDKKILACFFLNSESYFEVAAFDQENDLSLLYFFSNEEKETKIINLNGISSISKDKYLICYTNFEFNFKCLLYYSKKKWSQIVTFFENCQDANYHKGILSFNGNEYLVYCYPEIDHLKMVKLDENFIVKNTNEEEKCFFDLEIEGCSLIFASSLLYNKYNFTYFLSISYILNTDYIFRNDEIQFECSYKSQLPDFEYYQQNNENITSSSYITSMPTKSILSTSFSKIQTSSLIFSSHLAAFETNFLSSISSSALPWVSSSAWCPSISPASPWPCA